MPLAWAAPQFSGYAPLPWRENVFGRTGSPDRKSRRGGQGRDLQPRARQSADLVLGDPRDGPLGARNEPSARLRPVGNPKLWKPSYGNTTRTLAIGRVGGTWGTSPSV